MNKSRGFCADSNRSDISVPHVDILLVFYRPGGEVTLATSLATVFSTSSIVPLNPKPDCEDRNVM